MTENNNNGLPIQIPTATAVPTAPMGVVSPPPQKYVTINGVMKLNPDYQSWCLQNQNNNNNVDPDIPVIPATTIPNPNIAIPIVSNMDDYLQISNEQEIPLTSLTTATFAKVQEPEFCIAAGLQPDTALDDIFQMFAKYEIPMGLLNKLTVLSEYDSLEFIIDDSGSMRNKSDTMHANNDVQQTHGGRYQTRWEEAQQRLKEMMEVLSYLPIKQIGIEFLNRSDRITLHHKKEMNPKAFYINACARIDSVFALQPHGMTPAYEKLQESLQRYSSIIDDPFMTAEDKKRQQISPQKISRYFFGDGRPNGGLLTQQKIISLLQQRPHPENTPITFISCTNEDEQVEWMKIAEEVIPYCSESDDFDDEAREVLRDQGKALPYSRGFHLICQLVAAMNPHDLDAMDESVPFTKQTLDHLLGLTSSEETYQHYFHHYQLAQRSRKIDDPSDAIKKRVQWNYQQFLTTPLAKDIPQVKQFQKQLLQQQHQSYREHQQSNYHSGNYRGTTTKVNHGVDSECACVIL